MTEYPYYWIKMKDGTVHRGMLGQDIRKSLDRRSDNAPTQIVYEVRLPAGTWIRVWTDEVEGVGAEIETHRAQTPSSAAHDGT